MGGLTRALALGLLLGSLAPLAHAAPPAAPYYSVHVATVDTQAKALAELTTLQGKPYARAEHRTSGYHVRFGAWPDKAAAVRALAELKRKDARVIQIEHPVAWILPGTAAAAPAVTATPAAAVPAPAPAPAPAKRAEPAPAAAASPQPVDLNGDLTELSLQDLLNVQVTSVSKHAEPLREAAAAIFVLSGEDIRRSGARRIVEALRMVPGLQVYRTNSQNYTVTSRGFSGDKLEVLLDGRSVYTPLTSSVFWDTLDTYMADIDRIEVIRGPGATLWGANAVNGVINIVTRHPRETQGNEIRAGGGSEEKAFGSFRSGSKIGDSGYGRFYAKAFERDATHNAATGADNVDGQRQGQAGFRTDWALDPRQDLTVSGDYYRGEEPAPPIGGTGRGPDDDLTGANLGGNWSKRLSGDSELTAHLYFDTYQRINPGVYSEKRDTGDLELQHRFQINASNTFIYGAGYRVSRDDTGGPPNAIIFSPDSRTLQTWNLFAQDQMKLGEGGELTLGSKFEHDSYTGFQVQPGIRLGWALGHEAYTWAAISRAVRLPNRIDEDIAIFCPPPLGFPGICGPNVTLVVGNPNFEAEKVLAYEWGARTWAFKDLSLDLATFYNHYTDLRSTETSPPPFGAFANNVEGHSYGAELWATWTPLHWLSVRPSYSYLKVDTEPSPGSTDAFTAANLNGGSPQHAAGLDLGFQPGYNLTFDAFARYVDSLPRQQVRTYSELNVRAGWRVMPSLELFLAGGDLLDASHAEAGTAPSSTNPTPPPPAVEVQRGVWAGFTWDWK